jgi:hypothetical protein
MRTNLLLGDSTIIKETVEYTERTRRFKLETRTITDKLIGEAVESRGRKKKTQIARLRLV